MCFCVYLLCVYREEAAEDPDFVFEEFVRLRVAGADESNETEA